MPQRPSFETLFRVSPNAYLLIDRERLVIDANPACMQLLGSEPQEVLGQHVQDLFDAGLAGELSTSLDRVFGSGHAHELQSLRSADGRACWCLVCTPIPDSQGVVGCMLLHMTPARGSSVGAGRADVQGLSCDEPARQQTLMQRQQLETVGRLAIIRLIHWQARS